MDETRISLGAEEASPSNSSISRDEDAATIGVSGAGALICYDLLQFRLPTVPFLESWEQLLSHLTAACRKRPPPPRLPLQFRLPGVMLDPLQLAVVLDVPAVSKLCFILHDLEYKAPGMPCWPTLNHPVHLACWLGRPQCLKMLLEHHKTAPFPTNGLVTVGPARDLSSALLPVQSLGARDRQSGFPEALAFRAGHQRCLAMLAAHAEECRTASNRNGVHESKRMKIMEMFLGPTKDLFFPRLNGKEKKNAAAASVKENPSVEVVRCPTEDARTFPCFLRSEDKKNATASLVKETPAGEKANCSTEVAGASPLSPHPDGKEKEDVATPSAEEISALEKGVGALSVSQCSVSSMRSKHSFHSLVDQEKGHDSPVSEKLSCFEERANRAKVGAPFLSADDKEEISKGSTSCLEDGIHPPSVPPCTSVREEDLELLCEVFDHVQWQPSAKCTLACFPLCHLISAASRGRVCPGALGLIASRCTDDQVRVVGESSRAVYLEKGLDEEGSCSCQYRQPDLGLQDSELEAIIEAFHTEGEYRDLWTSSVVEFDLDRA